MFSMEMDIPSDHQLRQLLVQNEWLARAGSSGAHRNDLQDQPADFAFSASKRKHRVSLATLPP
jgi:hypothetical protein